MCDILNIKDFGAVGDGVTDDAPSFQAALASATLGARRTEFAASHPVYVPPVDIGYRLKSSIEIRRTVKLIGSGGRWTGQSKLLVNKDVTAIDIRYPEDSIAPDVYEQEPYSGLFAEIRGLTIQCDDPETTAGYGILANATCFIVDCFIGDFGLDGVYINASGPGDDLTGNDPDPPTTTEPRGYYGNANLCHLERVACWRNKGNGFRILGNNTNACVLTTCDATRNLGCGFLDESSLGNTHLGCHAAANAWMIGHQGGFYGCIKVHVSSPETEPGVGSNWRDYWQEITTNSFNAEWQPDMTYLRSGSYHTEQAAARNVFIGCYSEAGIQGPAALSKNDTVVGGNLGDSFYTSRQGVNRHTGQGVTVLGQESFPIICTGRSSDDVDVWRMSLGTDPTVSNFLRFGHNDDIASLNGLKFAYNKVRKAYEWVRDTTEKTLVQFTTAGWDRDGLSGDEQVVFPEGLLIGGGDLSRWRAYPDIESIPQGMVVTTKDRFILTDASLTGDPTIAVVTTAGTVGTDAVIVGVAPLP